ncbi:ap-domain-containing protein [Phaffia rhodozyma]|uniref:Ap-domain-containing protein n=1 Tax=Phaffia rhodozyma TaxID=264483 RepID=A0A0F7SSE2_PHARH|nr:ap-domain-containing protein [Phaffia rhodozyma]
MSASKTRNERLLVELSKLPGNDICADCRSPAPRWCSWNLGIFLCVSCASVHRKMGTHISRVKSLTLDTFTREQVDTIRDIGNIKSNLKINNDDSRNPPPTNLEHGERDNELERYIRRKYDTSLSKSSIVQAAFRHNPAQSSPVPVASSSSLYAAHPSSRAHQNDADELSPPPLPVRTPSQAPSSSMTTKDSAKAPVFGSMLEHRPANGQGVGHPGGVEPMRRGRVAPTQGTTSSLTSQPLQYAVPSAFQQQQQSSYQIQPPLQYVTQPSFQYTAPQQGSQNPGLQSFPSPQNPQLQQQQQLSFQSQPQAVPPQSSYQSYGGWFDLRSTGNGPTEFFSNQYAQSQPTPSSSSVYDSLSTGGSYGSQGSFPTGMESGQYPNIQLQQQQQSQIQGQQQSAYGLFNSSTGFSFQQQQPGPSSTSSYSLSNGMNGSSMMSQSPGLNQTQSQSQGQFVNGLSGQSTSTMGQGQMQMQMQGQAQGQGFGTQSGFMMGMMPSRTGAGWHA